MSKMTPLSLEKSGGLDSRRLHLREISDGADAPLETVGQDLRAARLRCGDDLATVSKALKIRKDHLEALEEDRIDALPGRAYAIGFVRSYAEYLGLDHVETVERFKNEIGGGDDDPRPTAYQDTQDEPRLPRGWAIVAVVVVGLIIYGAYHLLSSRGSPANAPVAPVPTQMTAPPQSAPPKPPEATPATAPADQAKPVAPGPAGTDQTQQAATAPQPPAAAPETAALPTGRTYGLRNTNARVILRLLEPTRVLVEGKTGMVYINRALKAGDTYRVPDLVGLALTTPDAGAVQIELDGQIMGDAGQPKQIAEALSLDPQAIVDHYNGQSSH